MKKSDYEKALDEFYQIEEDVEDKNILIFDELTEEEKDDLRETMGNEFRHAENHFAKNKDSE